MTYKQTISQLYDLQQFSIKLGLDNIRALCRFLKQPQDVFPSIHLAGTNGKGSTAFYISKILQAHNLKVGLYTSPHLVDFRERIRINDQLIEKEFIVEYWQNVRDEILHLKATFFDTTTALAFSYFAENKVDVAVIETGLGGRLDSTNILFPNCAIITPIGFDHQKQLGNTIKKIAREKAGIIKPGIPVFSAYQDEEALEVLQNVSPRGKFYYLPALIDTSILSQSLEILRFRLTDKQNAQNFVIESPSMAGYQKDNIALAYLAARFYLTQAGIDLNSQIFINAIASSVWSGRLQLIQKKPNIIFDVSHNLPGIRKTVQDLLKYIKGEETHLLFGLVNDKEINAIVEFLSGKFKKVYVCEPVTPRKQDAFVLEQLFRNYNQNVELIKDLNQAFESVKSNLEKHQTLLAMGSHYLIGELMLNLTKN